MTARNTTYFYSITQTTDGVTQTRTIETRKELTAQHQDILRAKCKARGITSDAIEYAGFAICAHDPWR